MNTLKVCKCNYQLKPRSFAVIAYTYHSGTMQQSPVIQLHMYVRTYSIYYIVYILYAYWVSVCTNVCVLISNQLLGWNLV